MILAPPWRILEILKIDQRVEESNMLHLSRRLLVFVVLITSIDMCGSVPAMAQSSQTGLPPFSSMAGQVDLANLNVHLTIPVLHKKGRGMPFDFDLDYDSTLYGMTNGRDGLAPTFFMPVPFLLSEPTFGWSSSLWGSLFAGTLNSTSFTCASGTPGFRNFSFTDVHSTIHPLSGSLVVSNDPACGQQQVNAFSTDQAGYLFALKGDGSAVVTDSSGITSNSQAMTDRNGNTINLRTNSDFSSDPRPLGRHNRNPV
jgi:hypothetical protein